MSTALTVNIRPAPATGASFTTASSLKAARALATGYADLDGLIGPMEGGQCHLFLGCGDGAERFLDELAHRAVVRGCTLGKVAYMNNTNYYSEKTLLRADRLAFHAKAEGIDPASVFERVYFAAACSDERQPKAAEALEGAMLRDGETAMVIVHGLTVFMRGAEGEGRKAACAGLGALLSRLWRASARMGAIMVVTAASLDGGMDSAPPLALGLANVAVSIRGGNPLQALLLKHPGRKVPARAEVAAGTSLRNGGIQNMGRITPPFRQNYQELLERLRKNYVGLLRDARNREAFELLLREAWDREHAAMGNAEVPLVLDALNLTANVYNRGRIEEMRRELERRNLAIAALEGRISRLEGRAKGSGGTGT